MIGSMKTSIGSMKTMKTHPTNAIASIVFYFVFPFFLCIWWAGFVCFLFTFLVIGGLLRALRLLPKRIPSSSNVDRDFMLEIQVGEKRGGG